MITRRDLLQCTAVAGAVAPPLAALHRPKRRQMLRCSPVQGIENPNVRCDHQCVSGGRGRAGTAHARLPSDACAVAQDRAKAGGEILGRRGRPARLWGQQQPGGGEKHASYSKRAMALDMAEVIGQARLRQDSARQSGTTGGWCGWRIVSRSITRIR